MAGRIRDEDIALVREQTPVADVLGDFIQLRNAGGGSLKGLCPFHDEKSPSLNVSPARGLWHCFGCQEGGDVFTFLQKIDQLSFVEAVETLAHRAGIQLRYTEGGYVPRNETSQRQRLLQAHEAAAAFYQQQIRSPQARIGRAFLEQRGFAAEQYQDFGVGYAPAGWEALTTHLRQQGFSDEEIILGGLASQGRRGPYDKFRNRLVWPIREASGDVVGFGARKLDDSEDGPKYLNTPETPIFKKSRLLYGIDRARRDIARERNVVVVEGYTDVMACHLSGVVTAVATCGTSFGDDHVKVLRRLLHSGSGEGGTIVFAFDGDAAGQRAAVRSFEAAQGAFKQIRIAVQPDGLDPCDLRLKRGDAAVRTQMENHGQLSDFVINARSDAYDLESSEGQLAAIDAVASVVTGTRDPDQRKLTIDYLAKRIGVADTVFIERRISQAAAKAPTTESVPTLAEPTSRSPAPYNPRDPSVQRERQVLKIAVQHPALAVGFDDFEDGVFTDPRHETVRRFIREQGGVANAPDPMAWATRLRENSPTEARAKFITALGTEELEIAGELDEATAREILGSVRIHALNRQINTLRTRLGRLDPEKDAEPYDQTQREIMDLQRRRRMLREGTLGST
ncbi:DNA primase [Spiractinospora alimapuensis]|uniref:DNA primase n=1 Tax=Spiractinospora alimapuensis TaxID=2820884 RepID=UPI001EEC4F8B|nr:DNA primase [Spiractinospora alimapuensis]QVQ53579.1 DNA primase [Spiractinospora alimapuensis]